MLLLEKKDLAELIITMKNNLTNLRNILYKQAKDGIVREKKYIQLHKSYNGSFGKQSPLTKSKDAQLS